MKEEIRADIEYLEEMARRMLGICLKIKGVQCPKCYGEGTIAYANTATWRKGVGGQMITNDVCDKCWGTGRTDRTGADLKKIRSEMDVLKRRIGGD